MANPIIDQISSSNTNAQSNQNGSVPSSFTNAISSVPGGQSVANDLMNCGGNYKQVFLNLCKNSGINPSPLINKYYGNKR